MVGALMYNVWAGVVWGTLPALAFVSAAVLSLMSRKGAKSVSSLTAPDPARAE